MVALEGAPKAFKNAVFEWSGSGTPDIATAPNGAGPPFIFLTSKHCLNKKIAPRMAHKGKLTARNAKHFLSRQDVSIMHKSGVR